MATLSLTGGQEIVYWTVSGLSAFTTANYQKLVISSGTTTSGSTTAPGSIRDTAYPGSGGTSVSGSFSFSAGTYTFYAFAQAANGKYYSAGSGSVVVSATATPTYPTPTNGYCSVRSVTSTSATFQWSVSPCSQARLYVRTESGTVVYDEWLSATGSTTITGMSPNTTYYYNIGYPNGASSTGWVYSSTPSFKTPAATGNVTVGIGSSIASYSYAYINSSGVRVPNSGYNVGTTGTTFASIRYLYIDSITYAANYGAPWYATYGGYYTSDTTSGKTSGTTTTVNTTIYPQSGQTASITLTATANYNYYVYWFDLKYSAATAYRTDSKTGTTSATWSFTAPSPSRTGYDLEGWCASFSGDNGTGSIVVGGGEDINLPYANSRSITLYARWDPHTYTIYFNGNGHTGGSSPGAISCIYGQSYTIPDNAFQRAYSLTYDQNYTGGTTSSTTVYCSFLYWSYNGTTYRPGASVSNLTATDGGTVIMYAQWEYGSVSLPTPTRTGYSFAGWYTSDGTFVGSGGSAYTVKSDQTLYAHWTESVVKPSLSYVSHTDTTITVTLDRNGGTNGTWTIQASTSSSFDLIAATTTITNTTTTSATLSGLSPNTTYYIRAVHTAGSATAVSNTLTASTRISQFQWTSDDTSNVVAGKVFTDMITASKWNDLIDKVDWCRRKSGLLSSGQSDVLAGAEMTAEIFNAMRDAIASMESGVTGTKEKGEEIKASYFANVSSSLKTAINAVITRL